MTCLLVTISLAGSEVLVQDNTHSTEDRSTYSRSSEHLRGEAHHPEGQGQVQERRECHSLEVSFYGLTCTSTLVSLLTQT